MHRRAAAALSAGSRVPIWPESLRTPQKQKEKENKTPNSWCFVFLHHLAFLRHIIILTFQVDRLAGATCCDPEAQKQLTSRVIALMMKLHP